MSSLRLGRHLLNGIHSQNHQDGRFLNRLGKAPGRQTGGETHGIVILQQVDGVDGHLQQKLIMEVRVGNWHNDYQWKRVAREEERRREGEKGREYRK